MMLAFGLLCGGVFGYLMHAVINRMAFQFLGEQYAIVLETLNKEIARLEDELALLREGVK